jgi:uncharacterized GH25 family protein
LLVVGYSSHSSRVELPADRFHQYLREEGLEAVVAERLRTGKAATPGRERFSRCAKSLLQAGQPNAADRDRALGFRLELVAERNPYLLAPGSTLPLRLTYEGRPLAGALVVAIQRERPAAKVSARTGADGRVHLRLTESGVWLVKSVHMTPAETPDADWASYWASLTFELRR